MRTAKRVSAIVVFFIIFFLAPVLRPVLAETYETTAGMTSTNLLTGIANVTSITAFGYNISSLPAGTAISVQFSQNNSTWYNSAGTVDGWDTLTTGDHLAVESAISLSTLAWSGANFYYKLQITTSDTAQTPLLDEVRVHYTVPSGVTFNASHAGHPTTDTTTVTGSIATLVGGNATIRGFKYGLSEADTWDTHEDGDFSTGTYTLTLSGLAADTTYYARPYAVLLGETFYGSWFSFSTSFYATSGTMTSTNLLTGIANVTAITKFGYNISSLPTGTVIQVQFSQNNSTWYSSAGVLNGWDSLSAGDHLSEGSALSLSTLAWTGANFYYKLQITTSDTAQTPLLDGIQLYYTVPAEATFYASYAANPTTDTTTVTGNIATLIGGNATIRGFKYGLSEADTWDKHEHGDFVVGSYTLTLQNLTANTTYYARPYAVVLGETFYGSWFSFSTGYYAATGTVTSTNILTGQTVDSIDEFDYTLASKPAGATTTLQFSQNNSTWYDSAGTLNGADSIQVGVNPINLRALGWTGANFYYKLAMSAGTNRLDTPAMSDVAVVINAAAAVLSGVWDFDEGYGTVAHNTGSGSSLNGTLTSMASGEGWTNSGKYDRGITLNGGGGYVAVSSAINNIQTVSFWIKPTGTTTAIMDFDGGTHTLSLANSTLTTAGFAVTPAIYVDGQLSSTVTAGAWHHVLVHIAYAGTFNSTTITMGKVGSSYFSGQLDAVKIYNYPLTAQKIKVDFNHSAARNMGADRSAAESYCVPGSADYCVPPVAEWKMDEGTGTSAYDTSGNGNTGTLTNGPAWTNGKVGKALNFNGSNNYVDAGTNTAFNITGDMTISMWMNPTTLPTSTNIGFIAKRHLAGGLARWHFGINNDSSGYNFYNGSNEYQSSQRPAVGAWSHVVMVLTSGTNVKYYTNGILVDTVAGASMGTAASDPVTIGKSGADALFNGLMDEVKIYNYARTPAQVAWDYNKGGPVGWYKFDETSGTTAYDSGSGAVNGTNSGATISTSCKRNNCLSFNGSSSYVGVTSTASVNAVSFWMKQGNTSNKSILYLDGTHSVTLASNAIAANGFSSPTIYVDGKAGNTVSDTNWHQVTITTATAFTLSSPTIGKVGSSYFTGYLDDVRFYNYALTATQVRDLVVGGAVRYGN